LLNKNSPEIGAKSEAPVLLLLECGFAWLARSPAAISAFCFLLSLGDGAKPPENRQHLPVAALHQLWQDGAGMNESEKQFSFTRAASSTSGRAKNQIPISDRDNRNRAALVQNQRRKLCDPYCLTLQSLCCF
jgi:hypothetical protein